MHRYCHVPLPSRGAEDARRLAIMRATWPEWIIRSGPMWWACLRAPLTPRERAAGLRPLIGRVSGAELAMELNAEDRAARRLAYASR